MSAKHILVLGAGSVGKRHLRNFSSFGCRVSAMDPLAERLKDAASEVSLFKPYSSIEQALADTALFDGVVVASPPKYHVPQCIGFIQKGLPILLEKPVSPVLIDALKLQQAMNQYPKAKLLLGYTYRWWPPLHEFLKQIRLEKVGRLLHTRFVMSAHLADWHPWERYQDFFMASKELGGGALLDESHFLDLMIWFFGMPEWVFAKVERISSLEIETDDNVDVIASYKNGLRVIIHLDLYGRPHEKYILIEGEKGSIRWSFEPNQVKFSDSAEQKWQENDFKYERNQMFINVAREFLDVLDGKVEVSCSLRDGIDVLKLVEACRRSSDMERAIYLKDI